MLAKAHDAFALRNSGLDAFLYADVGTELNGSALTILSMIARLGGDPWDQAARWARLPKAAAIDGLARSIAQMPLAPSALAEARVTAERLAQLLPATMQSRGEGGAAKAEALSATEWVPITLLYCAMLLGMAVNALLTPKPSRAVATPAEHSMPAPAATGVATVPLPHDEGVAGTPVAPSGD